MLSMEGLVGTRALGEESLQMWDLNKRLEAYLARVKFLEEENEVLRAEIQSAKGSPGEDSWRTKYEEELRALRATLDDAFREKCSAELARDNLYEEIQHVKSRCQKEQAAREEAKKQLSMSKKELEEERRAQIWLKERALQLEKEVEALLEVHEEEKAGLDHEIASFSQSLESFRCVPVAFQPVEVEDYSKRLSEIWKGAVETYKTEVSQLESSLCQAKENLWKAVEDNQQSQLQLRHLEKDLAGLKARKDMLEESLSRQWQEQRGEAEKFQVGEGRRGELPRRHPVSGKAAQPEGGRHPPPGAGAEATARPHSPERPEPLSLTAPEPNENKHPHEEAKDEKTQDPSEEPPGKSPAPQLLYPDQLVTEALEDALKEVRDDAQPKEEPMLRAERATEGYRVGSTPELPGQTAADHPMEEVDGTEDANFEALLEERAGGDMHEEPDMERTAQQDGATSHLELGPSSEQEEESAPDFLVAAQSETETQEAMRSWEEEGSKEEEMQTLLSPEESGEPEFVRDAAGSPLGEDMLASSEPDAERWEGSTDHPSQAATAGGSLEEPEQGEDDVEAVSTEALHLSEDEERRGLWSPSREDEERDFSEAAKEVREEESLQKEIQATHACPMESHPVLPGEGHLEEDLVEREQESLGHQEMPLCETDPAVEEERREEMCPEHELSSTKESISAEASSRAEEDTTGEEIADRARDGEGEMGEPGEEALEGEDLKAEGKMLGPEDLRQEEVTLEQSGVLQENGFEDDTLEQEELETLPREEVLGSGDDDNFRKDHPEDWEMKGEEDTEGSPGTEDANVTPQEPAWVDDILTSTGVPESEETEGILPAEIEAAGKDDEDDTGSSLRSQQEPTPQSETEQEAEPALGLVREAQEGHQDQLAQAPGDAPGPGGSEEPAAAPEASWEAQARAEDAEDELPSEPEEPEKASTGSAAFHQAPGDYAESDERQEEDAQRTEELGQEPGTSKSIQLEDTLPDNTPLHLYEGQMLAAIARSPTPRAGEDAAEPAPASEIALEDEGELEGSHRPITPLKESHEEEEEAGMESAPAAECAEEEEGYFMVSAPNQEAPSSEDAEISEDFEEIKVEATEANKDDLKAPRETSPAPEDEGHFEALAGQADEGIKTPTEEREMPKAGDFTAELEEAMPAAEQHPMPPAGGQPCFPGNPSRAQSHGEQKAPLTPKSPTGCQLREESAPPVPTCLTVPSPGSPPRQVKEAQGGDNALPFVRPGKTVVHQLSVSLEDLYNGTTRKLSLQKNIICRKCGGCGVREGAQRRCPKCHGSGMEVRIHQLGPSMIQQIQTVCTQCQGQGEWIRPRDCCLTCNGRKVVREKKILSVHLDKGMKDGQKITFHEEGDQVPGLEPGDIIIVLDQKEHPVFRRSGDDLIVKREISLADALCGCRQVVRTLDNRTLLIASQPGDVIRPGDLKCVPNEGMPVYRSPFQKGKLIVQFQVKFPEPGWLPTDRLRQLQAFLPPQEEVMATEDTEEVELSDYTPHSGSGRRPYAGEAYHEDDFEDGSRQHVQCQTS
nr:PREDICTED: nestin-like [Struthio camelus australis]